MAAKKTAAKTTAKKAATAKKPTKKVTKKVVAPIEVTEPVAIEKKRRRISKKAVLLTVLGLIIVLTPSIYFYNKYQDSQQKLKHPELSAKEENQALINKVAKHACCRQMSSQLLLPSQMRPSSVTRTSL